MTNVRRAPRIDVIQARSDREIIRRFVAQLGPWQSKLARFDAELGHIERRGEEPQACLDKLFRLRAEVEAGLEAFDIAVCGRPASSLLTSTRKAFIRLSELIDTIADR